jgi:hypothetical protein
VSEEATEPRSARSIGRLGPWAAALFAGAAVYLLHLPEGSTWFAPPSAESSALRGAALRTAVSALAAGAALGSVAARVRSSPALERRPPGQGPSPSTAAQALAALAALLCLERGAPFPLAPDAALWFGAAVAAGLAAALVEAGFRAAPRLWDPRGRWLLPSLAAVAIWWLLPVLGTGEPELSRLRLRWLLGEPYAVGAPALGAAGAALLVAAWLVRRGPSAAAAGAAAAAVVLTVGPLPGAPRLLNLGGAARGKLPAPTPNRGPAHGAALVGCAVALSLASGLPPGLFTLSGAAGSSLLSRRRAAAHG